MKIGIISDLHMEFSPWYIEPKEDVFYINAGDTHPRAMMRDYFEGLFDKNKYFAVRGNHDYYGGSFDKAIDDFYSIEIDGLKIAGATLWSDLSNGLDWQIYCDMLADKKCIDDLTFDEYMLAHRMQKQFLLTSNADIIVSHHAPSYLSCADEYKGNAANPGFMTEMFEDIINMPKPPKLWIHGHVHTEWDYMIGETRVICHPRGYPREMPTFNTYEPKIVEI